MSFTAYSKWGFLQRICHTVKLSILVKLLNFPLIHFFKSFFFIALLSPRIQYFCNTFSHLHLFSHFLRHGLGLRLDWTFKSSELLLWNEVFSLTLISIYVWETESVFIHANSESYMLKLFCFPNIDDNLDICIYGLAHVTLYRNWHAHKSRCKKWPSSSLKKKEEKKEWVNHFSVSAVVSQTRPMGGHLLVTKQAVKAQTGSKPYLCSAFPRRDQSSSACRWARSSRLILLRYMCFFYTQWNTSLRFTVNHTVINDELEECSTEGVK